MIALAEQCMADYDENGWTGDTWLNPDDVAYPGLPRAAARGGVSAAHARSATIAPMSWIDQRPDDMAGAFAAVGREHIATVEQRSSARR